MAVEAALIANTDTIQVVSLGVRTYPFNLPRRLDAPVLTDVEMIPHTVETTAAVAHLQIFFREIPVRPGGGTVDHNPFIRFPFLFLRKKNRISNTTSKILSIIASHFL